MTYIKLKSAISAAEMRNGLHELDLVSRELLQQVAAADHTHKTLTVTSLTRRSAYGTPPTIHARIERLVTGGWIERVENPSDKRSFLLELTPQARTIFQRISKLLEAL